MIPHPHSRTPRIGGLVVAALLAACTTAPESRYAAVERNAVEETAASGRMDDMAGLGLAANPTTGAFFQDGASGDVRARTENEYARLPLPTSDRPPQPASERMMVRTAELVVEVPRAGDAIGACEELAAEHGGYVSRRDGSALVCRVPAARFQSFVDSVKAMGRVIHEAMQALDVTEQHRDLSIRLDNAKRSRERLLALLEKAEEVEDLLKIENELRRLTEEIERMTAELQNLESRVALSTVTVTFQALKSPDRPTPVRRRPSRFQWINVIGAENVLRSF